MDCFKKTNLKNFQIYYKNKKEFHVLKNEIFREEIYEIEIKNENPVIVDIGAHIGLSTIYFKQKFPKSKIISLEPHPENYEILEKNIFENNLKNTYIIKKAICLKNCKKTMYYDETNLSTTSFKKGAWDGKEKNQKEIEVECITLNELINEKVDILKLDIEGMEYEILLNSRSALKLVSNLIFEYHFVKKNNLEKLFKFLKTIGFNQKEEEKEKMKVGEMKILKFLKN